MKIQPIYFYRNDLTKQQAEQISTPIKSDDSQNRYMSFAYKDFAISFGDRLNRTPENFYAQSFNRENMPNTAKKYLFENYSERQHMPPAQLQREAYQYLMLADTVQDVKDMYPEEPLFEGLRSLDETRPTVGTLLLLKWDKQVSDTPVFKNPENKDLTVYLLKKVYLEGKTVDEINKDFDKDATDEIKKELGIKDKKYFSSTNLRTLGIRYPKLPYYNSFLATRNDKEYIPPVRTSSSHVVSAETCQKLSEASKTWWAGLNELERMEQIQKMMNGREDADSIFDKFKGPIMTLAAAKMNFSEKLSAVFAEKLSDEKFKEEFPSFEEQQREIMLEFWNKDPEFRKDYSTALKATIADFDFAYHEKENPEYLEDLLNQALEQKSRILEKAKQKRHERIAPAKEEPTQASDATKTDKPKERLDESLVVGDEIIPFAPKPTLTSKEIFREFPIYLKKHLENHSKLYQDAMFEFLNKNTPKELKAKLVATTRPNAAALLGVNNDEEMKAVQKQISEEMSILYSKFDEENPLIARANYYVIAPQIFEATGDFSVFNSGNYKLSEHDYFKNINKQNLKNEMRSINNLVSYLNVQYPKDLAREFFITTFYPQMMDRLKHGFSYLRFGADDATSRQALLEILNDEQAPDVETCISELRKHNAAIRLYLIKSKEEANFANDIINNNLVNVSDSSKNNPATMLYVLKSQEANEFSQEAIMDSLVRDYLYWVTKYVREKKLDVSNGFESEKSAKYKNPKILTEINKRISAGATGDFNFTSTNTRKVGFGCFLYNNYLKYLDEEYKMKFLDFTISHPIVTDEKIMECFYAKSGNDAFSLNRQLSPSHMHALKQSTNIMLKTLFEDFKKEYPILANANEFALKEAFSKVSNSERSDIWLNDILYTFEHIKAEDYQDKMQQQKDFIVTSSDKFQEEISGEEISAFYEDYVYEMFTKMVKASFVVDAKNVTKFDKAILEVNQKLSESSNSELLAFIRHIKQNRGVYEYVRNEANPIKIRDLVLREMLADYVKKRANLS